MPACFILEGLAQTGGILVGEANDFKEKVVLAKITSARFHREALAGETLIYDVELQTLRPEGASVSGKVFAMPAGDVSTEPNSPPIAEAEIFFAHLDKSRSQQLFGDQNFVFSGELKHLLGAGQGDGPAHGRRHLIVQRVGAMLLVVGVPWLLPTVAWY